jgi:hypothetical protein
VNPLTRSRATLIIKRSRSFLDGKERVKPQLQSLSQAASSAVEKYENLEGDAQDSLGNANYENYQGEENGKASFPISEKNELLGAAAVGDFTKSGVIIVYGGEY